MNKRPYRVIHQPELDLVHEAQLAQGLPPKYKGTCRALTDEEVASRRATGTPAVVRFRMPSHTVSFTDLVRGRVEFNTDLIGDIIIARGLRDPLYNFAVVVDDHEMDITHVIRGEDHLSNTPKQIALYNALGWEHPQFAHLPLILGPDRKKLSKRFLTASLLDYRREGYLPEAVLNFLVLLGWHPVQDREIISLPDMIKEFSLKRVQKGGAVFNPEKLDWLNGAYLRALSPTALTDRLLDFLPPALFPDRTFLEKAVMLERDRMKKFSEFTTLAAFLFKLPDYPPSLLIWKQNHPAVTKRILESLLSALLQIERNNFTAATVERVVTPIAETEGRGEVLWPFRVALSGQEASPGPFELADTLGKDEIERRVRIAIAKLERLS